MSNRPQGHVCITVSITVGWGDAKIVVSEFAMIKRMQHICLFACQFKGCWMLVSELNTFHPTLSNMSFVVVSMDQKISPIHVQTLSAMMRCFWTYLNLSEIIWIHSQPQRAKKVMSDSAELVDFAIRQMNPVLNLTCPKIRPEDPLSLQKNGNQCCWIELNWGYLKDSWASTY